MILDELSAHMTTDVRNAIADCGLYLEFVTGGYTSWLQVMDIGLNKPFKNHYRDQYNLWFMTLPDGIKPRRQDIACWVENSWAQIGNSIMTNSWRKVGLPNPNISLEDVPAATGPLEEDYLDLFNALGIHDDDDDEDDAYPDNGHDCADCAGDGLTI